MSTAFAPAETVEETITVKIAKLLRHAEKAATEAERDLYLSRAQTLSTRYQIDLEVAKAHQQLRIPKLTQKRIRIGERGKRGLSTFVNLFGEIARANDVQYNVGGNGVSVIPFGYDTDIEIVEALHGHMVVQMVQESDAFIRSGKHREDVVYRSSREVYNRSTGEWEYRSGGYRPISGVTARINFQEAFGDAVGRRLRQARKEAIAQAQAEQDAHFAEAQADGSNPERQQGAELVLHAKADKVTAFYKANSTARGSYRGGSSRGFSATASDAGRSAGQRASLGGKAVGGHRRELG
jgi:uncharacterized protein DUF2786